MLVDIASDILTIVIFAFFFAYIAMKRGWNHLTYVLLVFTVGVFIVSISDIISLMEMSNPYVECIGGKFTAMGSLIGILGLLTSLAIFPRRNIIHRALPSIYVASGILTIYLMLTPHLMYCDPILGNMRGPLWNLYALWAYSLLILAALIPFYNLLTSRIRIERLQSLYMSLGSIVVIGYLGIAQIVPLYVENFEAFSAVHVLPLMGLLFNVALVRYGMYVVVPKREHLRGDVCEVSLERGEVAGISNVHTAFRAFRREISRYPGMVITVRPPEILRRRYVMEKTPIIWLTYFPGDYNNAIIPDRLHFEATYTTINFVDRGGEIIIVDGAEYIMENFGRRFFAEFLEEIRAVNGRATIILGVESTKSVSGLADRVIEKRSSIADPRVIMVHDPHSLHGKNMMVITCREEEKVRQEFGENTDVMRITQDFDADRLFFEGIKKVEESPREIVYVECLDHIISVGGNKRGMNFLKDLIDVVLGRDGFVYLKYTPRAEEIPEIALFIESVQ